MKNLIKDILFVFLVFIFFFSFTNDTFAVYKIDLQGQVAAPGNICCTLGHTSTVNVPYDGSLDLGFTIHNRAYDSCHSIVTPIPNSVTSISNAPNFFSDQFFSDTIDTIGSIYSGSSRFYHFTQNMTWTLECDGFVSPPLNIIVGPAPAPTVNLTANPTTVSFQGTSDLTWTSTNTDSCVASSNPEGFWEGNKNNVSGIETTYPLFETTVFTLTCTGPGGTVSDTASVTVLPPLPPVINLSATPSNVYSGGGTNLTWSVSNAVTCTASGGWSGSKSQFGGSQFIGNITVNTTFTLSCTGPGGSSSKSANVTVSPALPLVNISASPNSVGIGGSTVLTWTVANATSCTASSLPNNSNWTNSTVIDISPSHSPKTINNLTTNTTFTLSCSGPGGTSPASVSVSVVPKPVISFVVNPTNVDYNKPVDITWTVTYATSCTASSNNSSSGWVGNKHYAAGTGKSNNLTQDTTFTLSCAGAGGTSINSVNVTVNPLPPSFNFSANPKTVAQNGSTVLTWSNLKDATSCTASSLPNNSNWTNSTVIDISPSHSPKTINNLTTNTTFTLSCSGPGGETSVSDSVVIASIPTINISANPSNIDPETNPSYTSYVNWTVTNATSCQALNGAPGWVSANKSFTGSQPFSSINSETTFTLKCIGLGGEVEKSVTITVDPAVPTVNLSASPTSIANGGSTTLTWTVANATSCTASDGWTGTKSSAGGTEVISNINLNTTFTLSCSGPGGNSSASVSVSVTPVPTVTLSANKTEVPPNTPFTLTWNVSNADNCTASNNGGVSNWQGSVSSTNGNHNQNIANITDTTTFNISCSNIGGISNSSVTVNIFQEKLILRNTRVIKNSTSGLYETVLSWTATNLNNCLASTDSTDTQINNSWKGSKTSNPSPYTGQTTGVIVKSVSPQKTKYTLSCKGVNSGLDVVVSLDLHTASASSSGTTIPDYHEN